MGWCSGTQVFDDVVGALLDKKKKLDKEAVISRLIDTLEDMDWDCQNDSEYWGHPVIQRLMKEKHPDWFEDDPEENSNG